MRKTIYILTVFILSGLSALPAGSGKHLTKAGTTAAQFLKIPVGSRAIGMGGAFVAVSNDASAVYWNPSGLALIRNNGYVSFVHTRWIADMQFNFVSAAIRAGDLGTFGASFTSLSMADMKVRTEFEPEGTGEYFSAFDLALGLSYARSLTERFSIGFTAKYIRQQIWHMIASSTAFDLGILFKTDYDWLTLGLSISNFGPKMHYEGKDSFINYDFNPDEWGDNENIFANLQTDRWDLPLMFRFGLAAQIIKTKTNKLITAIEARHPNDNTESISLGAEYGFKHRFFLRAGYQSLFEKDSEKGLTAGIGFVYYLAPNLPLLLDYAYADWNRLINVHRFSIEFRF